MHENRITKYTTIASLFIIALFFAPLSSSAQMEPNTETRKINENDYNDNAACLFVDVINSIYTPDVNLNFIKRNQRIITKSVSKYDTTYSYSRKGIAIKFLVINKKALIQNLDIDGSFLPRDIRREPYLKSYLLNNGSKNASGNLNFVCDFSEISILFKNGLLFRMITSTQLE